MWGSPGGRSPLCAPQRRGPAWGTAPGLPDVSSADEPICEIRLDELV